MKATSLHALPRVMAFVFTLLLLLVSANAHAAGPASFPAPPPPADPLEITPEVRAKIGTDATEPLKELEHSPVFRRYFPYYEERTTDTRLRIIPPVYLESTRGLGSLDPRDEDMERLIAMLYYQRRSRNFDADFLFPLPLAWHVRDHYSRAWGFTLFAHRDAPHESDNWLAPLFFVGARKHGGYLHLPPLLTTSWWGEHGAFTLSWLYFRSRIDDSVHSGVAPFYFRGERGTGNGDRRTYTLIPPLLFFNRERESDESSMTVAGPVVVEKTPKRSIVNVLPLVYQITGRPQSGGIPESHTTVLPFVHYGHSRQTDGERSLFVLPGYLRRTTPTTDTLLTPFFSRAKTRNSATQLTLVGPVLPLFFRYQDRDVHLDQFGFAPLFYTSSSPAGKAFLTPLLGRFESYGESRTWWIFPTITHSKTPTSWEANVHPLIYLKRGKSSHSVVAPLYWDFETPKSRVTIGFPLYWRFANETTGSVTQVAGNTVYIKKRVAGGSDWQFHVVPLFSYGENPEGYFWNILFGLAGYERRGSSAQVKALWLPIDVRR